MNVGKKFERDFQKSVPDYALIYRIPDPAQSFGGSNNLRFSKKNPFDFLMWDSNGRTLFALELKTVAGKSISFEREKGENKEIHLYQINGLTEWSKYNGIIAGFVISFRSIDKTIFLRIENFNRLVELIEKKSFTIQDLENNNIDYFVIPQTLLRVRYRYDVDHFIQNILKDGM